jgi:hypothetical protein
MAGNVMMSACADMFFQECPAVFSASLDTIYNKTDLIELCAKFYKGAPGGLAVSDALLCIARH